MRLLKINEHNCAKGVYGINFRIHKAYYALDYLPPISNVGELCLYRTTNGMYLKNSEYPNLSLT